MKKSKFFIGRVDKYYRDGKEIWANVQDQENGDYYICESILAPSDIEEYANRCLLFVQDESRKDACYLIDTSLIYFIAIDKRKDCNSNINII